jgi:UDP-glucuronate decarboxylase
MQRQPDISLAKKVLNFWEPQVKLDDGLELTVAYFRKKLGIKGLRS